MRRMENDLLFFHELIGNCSVEKDSKIYTISPKFGKGTMQSFEVMPGAEIVYSNVHITTPIQKNIQWEIFMENHCMVLKTGHSERQDSTNMQKSKGF